MEEMQLESVEMVFTFHKPNGEEVKIHARDEQSIGWQQWGASKEELSSNVGLIEELSEVIGQYYIAD